MTLARAFRFPLFSLAAQNVGQRRARAVLLGLAIMLAVGVGYASFTVGAALRVGVATSFSRMGADMAVVPYGTLVNITSSLLTVQPTDLELDGNLADQLRAIPGIAHVAPQRLVRADADGRPINLVAYDPDRDFTVQPWLAAAAAAAGPLAVGQVLIGERVEGDKPGSVLRVCGEPLTVRDALGRTGVGPFDESYFVSFATLDRLIAAFREICRLHGISLASDAPARTGPVDAASLIKTHNHVLIPGEAACLSDIAPGRVSAFLIQLAPRATTQRVAFALGQIPGIKVVMGNPLYTSTRQALGGLFGGFALFGVLLLLALMLTVALLFSAIVRERYRELGLLRAMGARPGQIMCIILTEAALVTGLGGLCGLGFGVALVLLFARSLGNYFTSIGVPFAWPAAPTLWLAAAIGLLAAVLLGVAGALVPAWRARRMEPFALIVSEATR